MTRTFPISALAALICCGAWAQPTAETPAFEAASVKPGQPPLGSGQITTMWMRGGPGSADPTRIDYHNASLNNLMARAYGVADYQLSGPDWFRMEKYDIVAKVAPGTAEEQFNQMLASLLRERFKLQFHRETKDMPLYSLTVGKGGPKLHPHVDTPAAADEPGGPRMFKTDGDGYPILTGKNGSAVSGGKSHTQMDNADMARLVGRISGELRAPVKDDTGLEGKYDIDLRFVTKNYRVNGLPVEDGDGPDIFAAVRAQLGLNLEQKKGPVEILVIDHLEKVPTGN
jgi:uncharacterized protein (TIGR03435 family)